MKKLSLFFSLLTLLCCTNLYANPIKKIVYFGDSLTDNGNLYKHDFHVMPKDPPYFLGRFSNNKVWSDYLSEYYRDHFNISSDNYAVGGATVILRAPWKGTLPVSLSEEITDYLGPIHSSSKDRGDALFIIMMGANDYDGEIKQDVNALTDDVVNKLNVNIKKLISKGAQHFLLFDVPDLSKTPRSILDPSTAERLATVTRLHHKKLINLIQTLKTQNPNVSFNFISMYEFFNDLVANTDKFNQQYNTHLTDTTTACWTGGYTLDKQQAKSSDVDELSNELRIASTQENSNLQTVQTDTHLLAQYMLNSPSLAEAYKVGKLQARGVTPCTNPEAHIFWDKIHPTTVVHQMFASFVEAEMAKQADVLMDHN